jgi:hypothetical protein
LSEQQSASTVHGSPMAAKQVLPQVPVLGLQIMLESHVPHEPPHPSSPQARPVQSAVHVASQVPAIVLQTVPALQTPHDPPQPSFPHARPVQFGAHPVTHWPVMALHA